jgi:sugar phosphate isomerase/epimerase
MISRRVFLKTSAWAALGSLGAIGKPAGKLDRIGLQLYTVRREMEKDFEGTLAKVAAIGYQEVEFAGYFNRRPAEVNAALNRVGLAAPSAHVPTTVLRQDWERVIEAAQTIGHRYLICPYLSSDERRSLDDYQKIAELFNAAGEVSKRAGIQFGYHNHDFEFVPIDGKLPYDVLLAKTDSNLVKMELDLYWVTKAGRDPVAYLKKYPGRFRLIHVKDMDNTPSRSQIEVGRGIIDFKTIFAQAEKSGVKHYFVEHDEPPSPLDSIRISFEYLKRLEC